jgi:Ca2+-binding RTX toxin-like protein
MRRAAATFAALTTVTLTVWSGGASATLPPAPIQGTKHSESIAGTRFDDIIYARGGGDEVNARRGADLVEGGRGNDTLYGHRGADILQDRHGRNALYGGKGRDVLVVSLDRDRDRLVCGPGWDVLAYSGRSVANDRIVGCERVVTTHGRG